LTTITKKIKKIILIFLNQLVLSYELFVAIIYIDSSLFIAFILYIIIYGNTCGGKALTISWVIIVNFDIPTYIANEQRKANSRHSYVKVTTDTCPMFKFLPLTFFYREKIEPYIKEKKKSTNPRN